MNAGSANVVDRLRFLKWEAVKSGKIQVDKLRSEPFRVHRGTGSNGGDLLSLNSWTKFENCENDSWDSFCVAESELRKSLETKPLTVRTKFVHENPIWWIRIITLLSNLFYKNNVFTDLKPDGRPFSIQFLKFVKRIVMKFPVSVPDNIMCEFNEVVTERVVIITEIRFILDYIKKRIQPCLSNRPAPNHEEDDVFVTRQELTHLWQHDQKKAIDIVNNNGFLTQHSSCPVDINNIEEYFKEKCKRKLHSLPQPPWHDVLDQQPEWLPNTQQFTVCEIVDVVNKLPSRRSPGVDGVTYETIRKNVNKLAPIMTVIFNVCLSLRRVPADWKHAVITLIPKPNGDPYSLDDWRPISLLLTFYKIFMKAIQARIMPWIVGTDRLSLKQKGSMPRCGLQEHVFCLKANVSDFLHSSGKLFVGFVDIKDAFGSIDHNHMLTSLENAYYPSAFVDLTRDIYTGSTFQVKAGNGISAPIARGKGIIQGCPWSVIAFEQGIDKWLRWIASDSNHYRPNPVQGYVDDVVFIAENVTDFKAKADRTSKFMEATGMDVKHRKCGVLQGKRSGNNWKKSENINIQIQSDSIPIYPRDKAYKYLGYEINIDNKSNDSQLKDIVNEFCIQLRNVGSSVLPTSAKIEAINVLCISKLNFYFSNMFITEAVLDKLEGEIVSYVRSWLNLNTSCTRSFMFSDKQVGGLGLTRPRQAYYSEHLSFVLAMLNSDDRCVRETARGSLELHMKKRGVPMAEPGDCSFGGYAVENKKLKKCSKINWPRSQWVHVFEMCQRAGVVLKKSWDDEYYYEIIIDSDVTFSFYSHQGFKIFFKQKCKDEAFEEWKSKHSQGRLAREVTDIDSKSSMVMLKNHKLHDKTREFVVKGRLQLLPCQSLLHTYYPNTHAKNCKLCNFPSDTVSHILNGCGKFKRAYQERHNRLITLIHDKVVHYNKSCLILKDQPLRPEHFVESHSNVFITNSIRPDITIINFEEKTVHLVEVSVPFDAHLNQCYQAKFDKYLPLSLEINDLGFYTEVIVLIIGSLGYVHKRFSSGLKKLKFSKREAKFMANFCSISAIIGSHRVWKMRCRDEQML